MNAKTKPARGAELRLGGEAVSRELGISNRWEVEVYHETESRTFLRNRRKYLRRRKR